MFVCLLACCPFQILRFTHVYHTGLFLFFLCSEGLKLVKKLMDWGVISFPRACHRRQLEWQIVTRFERWTFSHVSFFALEGCLLEAWYQQWRWILISVQTVAVIFIDTFIDALGKFWRALWFRIFINFEVRNHVYVWNDSETFGIHFFVQ